MAMEPSFIAFDPAPTVTASLLVASALEPTATEFWPLALAPSPAS